MQAPSMQMAPVSSRAEAKESESAGVTVERHSVQVGSDSLVQVPSMPQSPRIDGDLDELSELPWDGAVAGEESLEEWR
jgi:hypothetical protein